jgi:cytochrome c oxidase subunit 2
MNPLNLLATTMNWGAADDVADSFWLPPKASTIAGDVDGIFFFIYWLCVFFFVLIVVLMAWFVIKHRRRDVSQKAGKTATHNTPLEVTWTVIPLILVIAIFYVGLKAYANMVEPPANAYEVYATAQKWSWTFEHRNGATEVNSLCVPEGRPVKVIMTSQDVLHAFYVPAFRVKQDAVPGRYTTVWFETKATGEHRTHQLFCAEYCGTDHSQMTAIINVFPQDQFEEVIAEKANWIEKIAPEEMPWAGYRLYPQCASCHSLTKGETKQGPSWWETHELWGKERVLKGGETVVVDENYVRSSILNPASQIVEGFPNVMPTFQGQLSGKKLSAIIEFVKHLDEVIDENGDPLPRD